MEVTKSSWTMNHNTLFLIKKIYISQKGSKSQNFFQKNAKISIFLYLKNLMFFHKNFFIKIKNYIKSITIIYNFVIFIIKNLR